MLVSKKREPMERKNFWIPVRLTLKLKQIAEKDGVSEADVVRKCLERNLRLRTGPKRKHKLEIAI